MKYEWYRAINEGCPERPHLKIIAETTEEHFMLLGAQEAGGVEVSTEPLLAFEEREYYDSEK